MIVRPAPASHYPWLTERTQCGVTAGFRAIEVVDARGRIRGMVGYDGWTENAVQAHMAVETPVAWRSLVRPAFWYPFMECKRAVLLGIIPAHNTRSLEMARRLGFKEQTRVADGWAVGDALVVMVMRRAHCRWLQPQWKVA